ncbi:hypothetical protein, partial [Nostoc sp. 2RC]|uniref:hypothetical protein n=1 Tax=Nostoc sp. 2RC TaxID=2485484 RepID=UPI001C8A27DB
VLVAVLVIVHKYYDLAIACASCVSPDPFPFSLSPFPSPKEAHFWVGRLLCKIKFFCFRSSF